ncbi:hypothetical protein [Aporhodopirellula aestuarii]|uniref:Uncharacterized protein n=1 Tax=Aporhodopirellula aestuarii TaxID=2950107 RepID=A0ABT0U4F9_9BACT|nr:hypothetical protein [Aporhodopirellula aestuarii]MCM2371231.1 hypothetical protein [Aporhodopirellula aestuarii]
MFDPFPAVVAFTPLIVYLFTLALIRIGGFVWVTTGGRDLAAVLTAISGMIVIGPMELFFPNATASFLGVWVWAPLLMLYLLFACLLILGARPKLVAYGRTTEEVYPAVIRAARSMDPESTAKIDQLQVHLPAFHAHLRLDVSPGHDCVSVLAFEPGLPPKFWNALRTKLRSELRNTAPPRPRRGWALLSISLLMGLWLVRYVAAEPALLVEGFQEWIIR